MATKYVDQLVLNEEAQDQWRHDPALRREFGEFSTYLAFMKADAKGAVKIISGRTIHGRLGIPDGNARQVQRQRVQSEDRKALTQWVQQTLHQIRAEHGAQLTDAKPHKVQTLDGLRRLSDTELLEIVTSEQRAQEFWSITAPLREEFPTPDSLWHFVKAKREGGVKILSR